MPQPGQQASGARTAVHVIMAIGVIVTVAGLRLLAVTVLLTVAGFAPLAVTMGGLRLLAVTALLTVARLVPLAVVVLVVVVLVAVLVTIGIGVWGAHSVSMPHAAASGNILAGSRVLLVSP
jgi:hypothetical protein